MRDVVDRLQRRARKLDDLSFASMNGEVEREAAGEIKQLREENNRLRHLAANAILMARNGDYHNGVTDPTGCIDEGAVRAAECLDDIESTTRALKLKVGATFYDNAKHYGGRG